MDKNNYHTYTQTNSEEGVLKVQLSLELHSPVT